VTFRAVARMRRPAPWRASCGLAAWTATLALEMVAAAAPLPVFVREWGPEGTGTGELRAPRGITAPADGFVYLTDSKNNRIVKYDSSGTLLATWGEYGTGPLQFDHPVDIEADAQGHLFVVDEGNLRVQKLSTAGEFLLSWTGPNSQTAFVRPFAVGVAPDGTVYISETFDGSIQYYSNDGVFLGRWGEPGGGPGQFSFPLGITVDRDGNVFVSDTGTNFVQKFSPTGALLARWGGKGAGPGQFKTAFGIAVEPSGDVLVVDHHNFRVQRFANDGTWLGMWGTKGIGPYQFASAHGMTCDARGQIYILDFQGTGNCCYVQQYTTGTVAVREKSWSQLKSVFRGRTWPAKAR